MDADMNVFYYIEDCSADVYDPNYEFEAPRYFDFSRNETGWEAEEAESWFESAGTCPPSPFIAKMDWAKGLYNGAPKMYGAEEDQTIGTVTDSSTTTPASVHCGVKETRMLTKELPPRPSSTRSSTLMKPTASHLAKLRACQEVQFNRLLRSPKFPVKDQETNSQHSSIVEDDTTKRQKLEAGYLRKAADLKHRAVLEHKLSKKVGENVDLLRTRLKVTVPREPRLETAHRALMHSYRSNHVGEPAQSTHPNSPGLKAQNLNHKIQPCLSKKLVTQLPEFQIVDTRNPGPASPSGETESKRPTSHEATQLEKWEVKHKLRIGPPEVNFLPPKHDMTISLLQKLKLESEVRTKPRSQSKYLKENAPSIRQVQEAAKQRKEKPSTIVAKQLVNRRTRGIPQSESKLNRLEKPIY